MVVVGVGVCCAVLELTLKDVEATGPTEIQKSSSVVRAAYNDSSDGSAVRMYSAQVLAALSNGYGSQDVS